MHISEIESEFDWTHSANWFTLNFLHFTFTLRLNQCTTASMCTSTFNRIR